MRRGGRRRCSATAADSRLSLIAPAALPLSFPSSSLRTVKGLADKLQSGWALLAQTCPQCNTPLVREKGGKRMFCVSCDLWVVRESDIDEHTQRQGQQQQQEKKPKEEAVAATGPSHLESGLVSLSDHALFDQTRRELRAENDGDEEEEEGEDHSSRPNQTAIAAKQRLDEYARARTGRASRARAAEEEEFELVAAEAAKADGAALAQHSSRMDSLSAKLGAKMMAGWTLMGDLCPNQQCTVSQHSERHGQLPGCCSAASAC